MAAKCFVVGCAIFRLIFLLLCGIGTRESTASITLTVMPHSSHHGLVASATLPRSKNVTAATPSILAQSTTVLINRTTTRISKPSGSASVGPSTVQPPMHSTVAAPTKPANHSATTIMVPTSEGGHGNPDARAKWVAIGFAIVFFITTVVMTVLFCRQRKIYRELEGDSSLSRLI